MVKVYSQKVSFSTTILLMHFSLRVYSRTGKDLLRKISGNSIKKLLLLFSCSVMSNSFANPWTTACQSPLSMGLSRQEYWHALPFPSPGDLPNPGIKPACPALASGLFTTEPPGKPV